MKYKYWLNCLKVGKINVRQPYIPVDHIIPLHLFLRLTDVLINLLIRDLRRLNALKNIKSYRLVHYVFKGKM